MMFDFIHWQQCVAIYGSGVLVLSAAFSCTESLLYRPDDIYVSPSQVRRFGLRTEILLKVKLERPRWGAVFALLKVRQSI